MPKTIDRDRAFAVRELVEQLLCSLGHQQGGDGPENGRGYYPQEVRGLCERAIAGEDPNEDTGPLSDAGCVMAGAMSRAVRAEVVPDDPSITVAAALEAAMARVRLLEKQLVLDDSEKVKSDRYIADLDGAMAALQDQLEKGREDVRAAEALYRGVNDSQARQIEGLRMLLEDERKQFVDLQRIKGTAMQQLVDERMAHRESGQRLADTENQLIKLGGIQEQACRLKGALEASERRCDIQSKELLRLSAEVTRMERAVNNERDTLGNARELVQDLEAALAKGDQMAMGVAIGRLIAGFVGAS